MMSRSLLVRGRRRRCLGAFAQAPESWQLVLVDRAGATKALGRLPPTTFAPRVSPDGRQVVFDAQGAVWIASLDNLSSPRRLATGAFPMWSGDGQRVLFIVGGGENQQLFWQAADGSGTAGVAGRRSPSARVVVGRGAGDDIHHAEGRHQL